MEGEKKPGLEKERIDFHGLSRVALNALTARQHAVHLRLGEPAHLAMQVCVTTPRVAQRALTDDDRRPRTACAEGFFQKLHMSMVSEAAGEVRFSEFGRRALRPAVHD